MGIHRWIPLTKASDVELWCFLWCAPEQTAEQTVGRDAGDLRHLNAHCVVTVMPLEKSRHNVETNIPHVMTNVVETRI